MTALTRTLGRRRRPSRVTAVLTAMTLAAALAACGGADDADDDGDTAGESDSDTDTDSDTDPVNSDENSGIKRGDTLTIAMSAPTTGLNPGTVDTAFTTYTLLAYEPLIYRSASGELQPALAESWEMNDDSTAMSVTVREGVTFTDGDPVNAEAIKGSLEYMQTAASNQAQYLESISDIVVEDEYNLTINLSESNPMLPNMLTQSYGIGQVISPTGLSQADDLTPSATSHGAGAYIYQPDESVAGDTYTYTANPDYYDVEGKQHFDKVVIKVIADAQATLNALKTGQVQVATGDYATTDQAAQASLDIAWTPFVWIGLNLIDRDGEVSEPLGDVRVRQAINYAIDRATITDALYGEYGTPTVQPSVEGMDGYSPNAADAYPYDVEKAKSLLAEAGYEDGFSLPVISVKFASIDVVTEALIPQLAEVGIELDPTYVTDAQAYFAGMTDGSYPVSAVGYGSQPMHIMGSGLFLPEAKVFNGFATQSQELVDMYHQAAAASPEERADLNVAMSDYLVDNAWFAPVLHAPVFYYSDSGIGGVEVSGEAPTATALDWHEK